VGDGGEFVEGTAKSKAVLLRVEKEGVVAIAMAVPIGTCL
jgi:hypothetical protein